MSTALEAASLVMVPSGYEDGTLASVKPTDGTGDFTFTRCDGADGCDLAATRVNADGYIEKGYENLLTYSNDFSNAAWAKSNTSVTSGQAGYDGTNNACLLSKSDAYGYIQGNSINYNLNTISVYAKAGDSNWIYLSVGGGYFSGYFDLLNGQTGTLSGAVGGLGININIEAVSGATGWYRCSVTGQFSSTQSYRIYIAEADGSQVGTSGSIYIQDAMVNQGLVAYPYIETTTAPVAGGILEDMPRLDYSNGSCPALLLEPQRTNGIRSSEDFTHSSWITQTGISVVQNTTDTTSPEGLYNAAKITSTSGSFGIYTSAFTTTSPVTRTIYLKGENGGETLRIKDGSGNGGYTLVTLTTEWVRYQLKTTNDGLPYQGIYLDDISTTGAIYAYGVQYEEGTYPTSYIPTYGVSQTRLRDEAPFPATFRFGTLGDGESGTMVVKTIVNGLTSNNRFNFFSNGGSANWYWNGFNLYSQTTGGSSQFILGSTASSNLGAEVKLCMRKSGNTLSCFFNGGDKGSIDIGSETIRYFNDFSTYDISQSIVEFEEFPTALTDSECIELTTI